MFLLVVKIPISRLATFSLWMSTVWEMWLMEDSILRSCEAWMSSSCSTLLAKALIWYATLARDCVV